MKNLDKVTVLQDNTKNRNGFIDKYNLIVNQIYVFILIKFEVY